MIITHTSDIPQPRTGLNCTCREIQDGERWKWLGRQGWVFERRGNDQWVIGVVKPYLNCARLFSNPHYEYLMNHPVIIVE